MSFSSIKSNHWKIIDILKNIISETNYVIIEFEKTNDSKAQGYCITLE